jgi:adenylate kinase family enzyme
MTLDDLGPRICIFGPSNSGKSTLAIAIGRARDLTPVHLDQLFHLPHTDWVQRPLEEFIALHDEAILAEAWVMEGNYLRYLPQRLARATGIILLDASTATSLLRYFRRSWFERGRLGALEGSKDSVKWDMIRYIAIDTRKSRRLKKEMFDTISLPKIKLLTPGEIADFYRSEGLVRPLSQIGNLS